MKFLYIKISFFEKCFYTSDDCLCSMKLLVMYFTFCDFLKYNFTDVNE